MKCAGCGKEIAQTAHFCIHCGARQATSDAGATPPDGATGDAAGETPRSAVAPKRTGSLAFVIGACVAIALVAAAAWRVLDHPSGQREPQASADAPAIVSPGQVPPPANESAAPLPPPDALPSMDQGNPVAEGSGQSDGAGADTSTVEESATAAGPSPRESSPRPASAARGASPRVRSEAAAKASKPAHPAAATTAATAPAKSAPSTTNPAQGAAAVPALANDHWSRMEEDMAKCTREDFINRVICAQRVKFRYCGDYWGKVPQCPGSPPSDPG